VLDSTDRRGPETECRTKIWRDVEAEAIDLDGPPRMSSLCVALARRSASTFDWGVRR
jgi:hypothetical protein